MSSKPISQREARELLARVKKLEAAEEYRRHRWATSYPGGTNFCAINLQAVEIARVQTASTLGHAIVARIDGPNLLLFAIPTSKAFAL